MQFQLFHDKCKQWAPIYMSTLKWQRHHVAGCFGNWGEESYGFTKLQEEHPTVKGSLGGISIGQWTGMKPPNGRRYLFLKFAADNNLDPQDVDTGFKFGLHELTTTFKHAVDQVRKTTAISTATYTFAVDYEMPGNLAEPARESWANRADSAIGELNMSDTSGTAAAAAAAQTTVADLVAALERIEGKVEDLGGKFAEQAGAPHPLVMLVESLVHPLLPAVNQRLGVTLQTNNVAVLIIHGLGALVGMFNPPAGQSLTMIAPAPKQ